MRAHAPRATSPASVGSSPRQRSNTRAGAAESSPTTSSFEKPMRRPCRSRSTEDATGSQTTGRASLLRRRAPEPERAARERADLRGADEHRLADRPSGLAPEHGEQDERGDAVRDAARHGRAGGLEAGNEETVERDVQPERRRGGDDVDRLAVPAREVAREDQVERHHDDAGQDELHREDRPLEAAPVEGPDQEPAEAEVADARRRRDEERQP